MKPVKKPIPAIGFSSINHQGVIHAVPFLEDENGKMKFMEGHSVLANCCYTEVIKTAAGQIVVTHSVIH